MDELKKKITINKLKTLINSNITANRYTNEIENVGYTLSKKQQSNVYKKNKYRKVRKHSVKPLFKNTLKKQFNFFLTLNCTQIKIFLKKKFLNKLKTLQTEIFVLTAYKTSFLKFKKIISLIKLSKQNKNIVKPVKKKQHTVKIRRVTRFKQISQIPPKLSYVSISHINVIVKARYSKSKIYDNMFLNKHNAQSALVELYLSKS
jgi:hypothetical protein